MQAYFGQYKGFFLDFPKNGGFALRPAQDGV